MTITPYGTASVASLRADGDFRSIKSTLGTLQQQISTGKVAETYAGLGAGAATSLSARAQITTLDGYASNVTDAKLRVSLLSQGVQQVSKLGRALANSLPGSALQTPIGQTSAEVSAEDGLKQVIDILNTQVSGRYLFSGRTTDTEPVAPFDQILNGDATHAGLKQLVAERKAADLGTAGRGRLTLSASGTATTLAEEAAGLPFGLKIASASATGTGLAASTAIGPPASATVDVPAQPASGDTVSIGLTLPDGSQTTIKLTATSGSPASGGGPSFAIGATAADTALNLRSALDAAVQSTATTTLAAASTLKASAAFFAGSASNPPARVAGPPYDSATATVAGNAANTVIWYRGDDDAGSARETAPVRIGDSTTIGIGARANEAGFQQVLSALGALAADSFPSSDTTTQGRYGAIADRIATQIGDTPKVDALSSDLSVANAALDTAKTRLSATKNQVNDVLDGVENTDPNKVASELLATQTRLQASYQTTSLVAKLSLVNYL